MKQKKRVNTEVNNKLNAMFQKKEILTCELRFEKCTGSYRLTYAHRHKRNWYLNKQELLSDFNHVILACLNCHQVIEQDKELTENKFIELRDNK
jgi:hypothetical protein